jgi:hypothetical protein
MDAWPVRRGSIPAQAREPKVAFADERVGVEQLLLIVAVGALELEDLPCVEAGADDPRTAEIAAVMVASAIASPGSP